MNGADVIALLPWLVIAGTGVALALLLAIHRSHAATVAVTIAGLAAAAAIAALGAGPEPRQVTSLLLVDGYALFYTTLICTAGVAIALLGYDYWKRRSRAPEEFYLLLVLAVLGSAVLVGSTHFVSFFLGLETLSVSLYAMIAYRREDLLGIEGGIKYLVLAAVSAAFLLFGMALVYAEVGTMEFSGWASGAREMTAALAAGVAMILVGFGFKLALVPFHLWTPDVYQGAPAPTTAFVATVSKGAVFALLVRFFATGGFIGVPRMIWLPATVAVLSMFTGNLLALRQPNVKRILAYSSIAHMGYLMVAFVAGGPFGAAAVAFYLVAYFVSTIGAFGVVAVLSGEREDADHVHAYRGLAWHRPWLAAVLSAALFSLAGIPLTAGFVGKFYVMAAGMGAGQWALVTLLVANSAIGLYYYLRVIVTMYRGPEPRFGEEFEVGPRRLRGARFLATGAALCGLSLALVWLGVYPAPLIRIAQTIAAGLM